MEEAPGWLSRSRLQGGCGGKGTQAHRAALMAHTEARNGQGGLEKPVGATGCAAAAQGVRRFRKQAEQRPEMRRFASRLQRALIPDRWTRFGFPVFARGACTGHGILGPS